MQAAQSIGREPDRGSLRCRIDNRQLRDYFLQWLTKYGQGRERHKRACLPGSACFKCLAAYKAVTVLLVPSKWEIRLVTSVVCVREPWPREQTWPLKMESNFNTDLPTVKPGNITSSKKRCSAISKELEETNICRGRGEMMAIFLVPFSNFFFFGSNSNFWGLGFGLLLGFYFSFCLWWSSSDSGLSSPSLGFLASILGVLTLSPADIRYNFYTTSSVF